MAGTAGELMSAPAVTVDYDASVAAAARRMAETHVKRMPVVDGDGRLIGIVSRRDLLRTHLRSDAQIRADVSDLLEDWFRRQPGQIGITVSDGVVTLVGNAADRRQAEQAVLLASSIDGVVAVVDRLAVVDRAEVT
jgi:CBS-domain-containing membrane protein